MIKLTARIVVLAALTPSVVSGSHTVSTTWSVGASGWTNFKGSPGTGTCGNASSSYSGTCVVYVANSGNDATCAAQPLPVTTNPAHPCATPAKAQALLRDHMPDWMLLKKGDKWSGGMSGQNNSSWNRSGKSTAEPMLISSYGTGHRPLFSTDGVDTGCYSSIKLYGQYMAIVGIECYVDFADPASPTYLGVTSTGDISVDSPIVTNMMSTRGIKPGYRAFGSGINGLSVVSVDANSITLNGRPAFTSAQRSIQFNKPSTQPLFSSLGPTNLLILEDCEFRFGGVVVQNSPLVPISDLNLRIRRNLILDNYGTVGRPGGNGFFLGDNPLPGGQILFEENLVDHSGYNTAVWGAAGNIFNHNFYLHDDNPSITFVRNIIANASATGAQIRNGGSITDNLLIGNPIGIISNPGVQFNPTTYSYNVVTEGSDIIVGVRNATGTTSVGSNVLQMDGVLTSGLGNFIGNLVEDLDNPGAIAGQSVQSVTATTAILNLNVAAGKRGNGVQVGDRLVLYAPRGMGIAVGPTGTLHPDVDLNGGTYPAGSTTFFFKSGNPLPDWVAPGMNLAVYQHSAFPGGRTKIASVANDRLSLSTTDASTGVVVGNEQYSFVIWTPGEYSHFPKQTFGPANIFTTSATFRPAIYAFGKANLTQNVHSSDNYYYNWDAIAANNVSDAGMLGTNTNLADRVNLALSNSYPKATIEAYDASIGGPGTTAHFIAQARLQSKDHWDIRYTANAANNFIRDAFSCNCAQ